MFDFFNIRFVKELSQNLFNDRFEPHRVHYVFHPQLMWFDIFSNAMIAFAYYSIPLALGYFVYKRHDIPFNWIFFLFSAFIFACGTHHILHIITFWYGYFYLEALVDFLTAIVSIAAAIALWYVMPIALKIPNIQTVRNQNKKLQRAELEVKKLNKTLEKRVHQRTRQLEKALQLRNNFISMASHELKTPITSLKGFVQVLELEFQRKGDFLHALSIQKIDKQIDKLTKLISNMLDLTRTESGTIQMDKQSFFFDSFMSETIDNLQKMIFTHTIVLKGKIDKEIYADKDRIEQVLTNLIFNAAKYSPKSDKIYVTTQMNNDKIIVSVKDFGIGIEKKHHNKIFNRFYRVTDEKNKKFPGLGIGLYISKEIIQQHGGKIWCESTLKRGSLFSFSLPLTKQKKVLVN